MIFMSIITPAFTYLNFNYMIHNLEGYKETKFQLESAQFELEQVEMEMLDPSEPEINWDSYRKSVLKEIKLLEQEILNYEKACKVLF